MPTQNMTPKPKDSPWLSPGSIPSSKFTSLSPITNQSADTTRPMVSASTPVKQALPKPQVAPKPVANTVTPPPAKTPFFNPSTVTKTAPTPSQFANDALTPQANKMAPQAPQPFFNGAPAPTPIPQASAPAPTPAPAPAPAPTVSPEDQAYADWQKYQKALSDPYASEAGLTEVAAQEAELNRQINQLKSNAAAGVAALGQEAMPLSLQRGKQAILQDQANRDIDNLTGQFSGLKQRELTLKDQLAIEQAKRQAQVSLGTGAMTYEGSKASKLAPIKLSAGETYFNPATGKAEYTAPIKPTTGANDYALAQSQGFNGSYMDFLQAKGTNFQDPASQQLMVQAILNGQMSPSQIPGGSRGGLRMAIENEVLRQNPNYNFAQAESSFRFGANTGIQTQVARIGNLVNPGGALDQLDELSAKVPRSQYPNFNNLTIKALEATGDPNVSAFLTAAKAVGDEIGNALASTGGSDLKVQLGLDMTNPNLTIEQFTSSVETARNLLAARSEAYGNISPMLNQYSNAGGSGGVGGDMGGSGDFNW